MIRTETHFLRLAGGGSVAILPIDRDAQFGAGARHFVLPGSPPGARTTGWRKLKLLALPREQLDLLDDRLNGGVDRLVELAGEWFSNDGTRYGVHRRQVQREKWTTSVVLVELRRALHEPVALIGVVEKAV